MNKFFYTTSVALLISTSAFAQSSLTGLAQQQNVNAVSKGVMFQTFDNRYEGVRGNPYFINSWLPGSIIIRKNNFGATEVFKNLKIKYNVHSNQLAAVVPETRDTILINTNIVSSFTLDLPPQTAPLEFRTLPEARAFDSKLTDVFFAVLYDGKNKLVKSVSKEFVKANYQGGYNSGNPYDELIDQTQYYLVAGGRMVKTKLNRKVLLDALPAQQEKLKSYITSNKLLMNSEADIIKVLSYADSL